MVVISTRKAYLKFKVKKDKIKEQKLKLQKITVKIDFYQHMQPNSNMFLPFSLLSFSVYFIILEVKFMAISHIY